MSVKVIGLERIIKRLDGLPKGATKAVNASLLASAQDIRSDAISRVPINEGRLKNSIKAGRLEDGNGAQVSVNVNYGAYIEFGTGKKVNKSLTNRYPQAAAVARNLPKAGNFKDMVNALESWVRLKGLAGTYSTKTKRRTGSKAKKVQQDRQLAYAIAIRILQNGIESQPYFFPAYEKEQRNIVKDAGRALSNYLRTGR